MPRNKVLTGQTRKMIYDVNCYVKKETNDLLDKLKQLKNKNAEATAALQNKLAAHTQQVQLLANRTASAADTCILFEICYNLEQVRQETAATKKAIENILQKITSCLKQEQKRTALATNTSVVTVRRIAAEAASTEVFRTPGKKRLHVKPVMDIDNLDRGVIKRCIHNFYVTQNELPTIEKLRQKLKEDVNFQGAETSLRKIIKSLGFKWKETENNRKILIEGTNIRLKRIEYLERLKEYREEGRAVIYVGETYIDTTLPTAKAQASSAKGAKKPGYKGQRVFFLHAASEAGFVPNALLVIKPGSKAGEAENMDYEKYEKWLTTQLIPNIPPDSVVVVDDAPYHHKKDDLAPTPSSKKAEMRGWLLEKGIVCDETVSKPQLLELINSQIEHFETSSIDKILAGHSRSVLRLPPHHLDLNPMETAWTTIKEYVAGKNVKSNINSAILVVREKVRLMGASEWQALCDKTKTVEEEYAKSDHIIELMTEQFSIRDDSSDSSDSEESDDDESDGDEAPLTSGVQRRSTSTSQDDSMDEW